MQRTADTDAGIVSEGKTVKAVVFDIGNVLIGWQPENFFDAHLGPERRRALFANVDLHGMNDAVDRGGDFAQLIRERQAAHPAYHDEIGLWHDRWIDLTGPVLAHSLRLLLALKQTGMPVFALSNFGIATFAQAERRYGFLSDFDRRYISGHLGVIKPEAEIYRLLEEDSGLKGEELLFTDDRADNIAAAAARGWQVHHFQGSDGLARCLVDSKLLREEDAG